MSCPRFPRVLGIQIQVSCLRSKHLPHLATPSPSVAWFLYLLNRTICVLMLNFKSPSVNCTVSCTFKRLNNCHILEDFMYWEKNSYKFLNPTITHLLIHWYYDFPMYQVLYITGTLKISLQKLLSVLIWANVMFAFNVRASKEGSVMIYGDTEKWTDSRAGKTQGPFYCPKAGCLKEGERLLLTALKEASLPLPIKAGMTLVADPHTGSTVCNMLYRIHFVQKHR